jgi:uncharacterized protein (TIGR02117 family)
MLKRLLKKILLGFLFLLAGYGLFALVLSYIPANTGKHECRKNKTIFVASNGIHLDIFVPTVYMDEAFLEKIDAPFSTAYVAFGWGDKDFYVKTPTWGDLSIAVTARALFVPTEAALHIGYFKQTYTNCVRVSICDHQLEKLMNYIENEFDVSEEGTFYGMPGYGPDDRFFDAKGQFMFYKTCNVWVNSGLKEAEIRTAVWSPFAFGVLHHLKKMKE